MTSSCLERASVSVPPLRKNTGGRRIGKARGVVSRGKRKRFVFRTVSVLVSKSSGQQLDGVRIVAKAVAQSTAEQALRGGPPQL